MQQFIYLLYEAELVGGAVLDREPFSPEGYPIYSRLLVCPKCCQPWAKLTVEGDAAHRPEMASCMFCDWSSEASPVPGSLIVYGITGDNVDWGLLAVLPENLLRREFNLTMKAMANAN